MRWSETMERREEESQLWPSDITSQREREKMKRKHVKAWAILSN